MLVLTGLARIDRHLGGLPEGVTHVYGPPGSGKSLFGLQVVKANDGIVICTTGMPDSGLPWLTSSEAVVPCSGESIADIGCGLLRSGCKVVVVDSLPGMVSTEVTSKPIMQVSGAATQRLIYHSLSELNAVSTARGATVLIINEIRVDIENHRVGPYMPHITRDRTIVRNSISCKRGSYTTAFGELKSVGISLHFEWLANRLIDDTLEFTVGYPGGFSVGRDLLLLAEDVGYLERCGAYWRDRNGQTYGPGFDNAIAGITPLTQEIMRAENSR